MMAIPDAPRNNMKSSVPFVPALGIAPPVNARQNHNLVITWNINETIRKPSHYGPTQLTVHFLVLKRIVLDSC
jgi:hypothetical protein